MFRRLLFGVLSTAIAVGCCVSFAATDGAAADCNTIQIISRALATREAEAYCKYAADERAKVETYWGSTWQAPIRIHVDESHKISRALVPAFQGNRGLIEMPLRRARNNEGALLHEIVHVYAPNPNRFLAEGFAVYLQARLGGNRSLPNRGESLTSLAHNRLPADGLMARLNKVRTPTPLRVVMDEMTAYVLAGSFVGFLIERYELPRFRRLYETEDYERVYGKSFQELELEWRSHLERQ